MRRLRLSSFCVATAVVAAALVAGVVPAAAIGGDLDPTWDGDGRLSTGRVDADEYPQILRRDGGGLLLAYDVLPHDGSTGSIVVEQRLASGALDPAWGNAGRLVILPSPLPTVLQLHALPGGGVLVFAVTRTDPGDTVGQLHIAKLTPQGERDLTFDTDGVVVWDSGGEPVSFVGAVPRAGDGFDLVLRAGPVAGDYDLLLTRVTSTGAVDGTYGSGGVTRHETYGGRFALQTDTGIAVVDHATVEGNSRAIVRGFRDSDGALDPAFGTAGETAVVAGSLQLQSAFKDGAGYLWFGGTTYRTDDLNYAAVVARTDGSGALDPVLGGDGVVEVDLARPGDQFQNVQRITADDSGSAFLANNAGTVAKIDTSGAIDPTFGEGGIALFVDYVTEGVGIDLALGDSGQLFVAGFVNGPDSTTPPGCPCAQNDVLVQRMARSTPFPVRYVALAPQRIYDSRQSGGAIGAAVVRPVQVAGLGGVPTSGASAVVLNVTAVAPTSAGYLTLFPTGRARPLASNVNFPKGRTLANLATVKLGDGGQVSIFNAAGSTGLLLDVAGYYTDGTAAGTGGRFVPLTPARILDSRPGLLTGDGVETAVGPKGTATVQVTGRGGVPATGVSAVVMNVTGVAPTAPGFLTVFPTGTARPGTSNVNLVAGVTTPNLVAVKLGSGGRVTIYNGSGSTHVLADVAGYVTEAGETGSQFRPLSPVRIHDTRATTTIGAGVERVVPVHGLGRVPTSAVAVVLNVTVTQPTANSYLTAFPNGVSRPTVSNLNFVAGQTVANQVVVPVGSAGSIRLFNASGTTHAVVDVAGWFG